MADRPALRTVDGVRPAAVTPTGKLRTFDVDDVIVSKTDVRGRLTYVNDVFMHVSRYTEDELIGRPHNIIRHPDMPRAVFKLLWDEIQAGREIFAYVLNLASDGVGYWVFAHVTPTCRHGETVGYHSNRRVPSPQALAVIQPLYARLRAVEQAATDPVAALEASTAALHTELDATGLTYDEFVWSLAGATR